MQSQRRDEEKEHDDKAHVPEEQENEPCKLFFIYFEPGGNERYPRIPKRVCDDEIEHSEGNADDKCPEEEVAIEDDLVAFHCCRQCCRSGIDPSIAEGPRERANEDVDLAPNAVAQALGALPARQDRFRGCADTISRPLL
jgi:hypothetical protein